MKRFFITAIIFVFVFSSCRAKTEDILGYQKYPMMVTGTLAYDGHSYAVTVTLSKDKTASISVNAPESLTGYKFSVENGRVRVYYEGMEIELNSSAADIPVMWITDMLSLSRSDYLRTEHKKDSDTVLFADGSGETEVCFTEGGTLPYRIIYTFGNKKAVLDIDTFIIQ